MSNKRTREETKTRAAIAFDIDGVFKYGREWSKDGSRALRRVADAGMPFVFVTNGGGGLTEASYAASMTSKIAGASNTPDPVTIGPERMVLSYTPWKTMLAPSLAGGRVLLIGDPRAKVLEVAKNYGINATHYQDYAIENDTVNPFRLAKQGGTSHTAVAVASGKANFSGKEPTSPRRSVSKEEVPFVAVLVMCDPYEWYEAHQAAVDVLCSPTPLTVEYDAHAPPMPIHFSNPDVLWKSEHPFPRFGQGAFKLALRALYIERLRFLRVPSETIDERISVFKQWGKPTESTFRFLEDRLRALVPIEGEVAAERYYMVGDNPTSDIEGARRSNIHHKKEGRTTWQGVLVKTGVYKEGDETNGAAAVVDGVAEAVDYILEREAKLTAEGK
jgi:HAD superfamily hydrolase (TIGR01456 family)